MTKGMKVENYFLKKNINKYQNNEKFLVLSDNIRQFDSKIG